MASRNRSPEARRSFTWLKLRSKVSVSPGLMVPSLVPPEAAPIGLTLVIWSALVFFLIYARSMAARGVLR